MTMTAAPALAPKFVLTPFGVRSAMNHRVAAGDIILNTGKVWGEFVRAADAPAFWRDARLYSQPACGEIHRYRGAGRDIDPNVWGRKDGDVVFGTDDDAPAITGDPMPGDWWRIATAADEGGDAEFIRPSEEGEAPQWAAGDPANLHPEWEVFRRLWDGGDIDPADWGVSRDASREEAFLAIVVNGAGQ